MIRLLLRLCFLFSSCSHAMPVRTRAYTWWLAWYVFISNIAALCSILIIAYINVYRCIGAARVLNIVRYSFCLSLADRSTLVGSHFFCIFVCCLNISVRRKFGVIKFMLHMRESPLLFMPALCAVFHFVVPSFEGNWNACTIEFVVCFVLREKKIKCLFFPKRRCSRSFDW